MSYKVRVLNCEFMCQHIYLKGIKNNVTGIIFSNNFTQHSECTVYPKDQIEMTGSEMIHEKKSWLLTRDFHGIFLSSLHNSEVY